MSDTTLDKTPKLDGSNYRLWVDQMKNFLMVSQLWMIVSGTETCPPKPSSQPSDVTSSDFQVWKKDRKEYMDWMNKSFKAAGLLVSCMSPEVKVYVRDVSEDPVKIWETLKTTFIKPTSAPRFQAYQDLFSIKKDASETLDSVINRVDEQVRIIKSLTPDPFTLDNLYDDLSSMTIITSLPHDFSTVVNTLAVMDKFSKTEVIQSLRNLESSTRQSSSSVLVANTPSSSHQKQARPPQPNNKPRPSCTFCKKLGHVEEKCFLKERLKDQLQVQGNSTFASASASASSASGLLSSPLDTPAYTLWNADSGASSHMTPHRHWLRNYKPCRIEVKLADGSSIYSEGVGSVLFKPVINGSPAQQFEFTNVLHVPALRTNLFSVLFLAMHRNFLINIKKDTLSFMFEGKVMFEAKVNSSTVAYLQGTTVPIPETANLSSATTLPLDLSLWHQHLCHPSYPVLQRMIKDSLVTGLKVTSSSKPDPICEPCLAGKMVADPFPSSSHRSTKLLGLIHSDVHGPIKVASFSGFKYWITFIDDSGRFRAAYTMKKKSEAFSCFKKFKAWAEKQTGCVVKVLREDKGGEYIGREFDDFCAEHGIQRQHSVRARPQQNGVAERANRTMEQGIASMLHQAGLPLSFWGEALAAFIHVWNKTPTSTLPGMTPYQAFLGSKPDVSMLRVWGCVAYVHIQKDKRDWGGLGSHMEKCIFIGYPPDYKGWKFYNPVTKKCIISERAQFDERYFLGIKTSTPTIIPTSLLEFPPTSPGQQPSSTPFSIPPPGGPDEESEPSDFGDMHDHGGGINGSHPTHPPSHPAHPPSHPPSHPPHLSPPSSPKRAWPEDYPFWLSSLSPEPPSSPREPLSPPSPPGTPPRFPLPVTRPPTPIPLSQTPIPPLLQRKQPRNPPAVNWKENQYKVPNAEQFRDKPKRTRKITPEPGSYSPLPQACLSPIFLTSISSTSAIQFLYLPFPLSLLPSISISLSPPPSLSHLPQPSPSTGPSSPAIWQHRDPTPAIASDEEDDIPGPVQASPDEDEGEDNEDDEEDDDEDDTYDPAADDTFYPACAHLASIPEPRTFKDSQRRPESSQWRKACLEELDAHQLNGTWKVVQLPPGKKVVGSKWHFKVKRNTDGSVERFKARLVAKGYSQCPGFDFTETFAPTVRYSAVRTILALAGLEDMEIHSLEVTSSRTADQGGTRRSSVRRSN
jgi:hypothetical protein